MLTNKISPVIFTLVLHSGPTSASAKSCLKFAQSVIETQHTLSQVFFYGDGVYCTNTLLTPLKDELRLAVAWKTFGNLHAIKLHVCISSAGRRGILTKEEAQNNGYNTFNLEAPFQLVGLGQLAQDYSNNHRIIHFGR